MRCDKLNALLDLYPGGPLTQEQRLEVEEHLASCPSCRLAAKMRGDARALSETDDLPEGFSASWRQAIREEAAKTTPMPVGKLIRWMSVAAALLVMVGGTWLAGEQRRSRETLPIPMAMEAMEAAGAAEDAITESFESAPAAGMAPDNAYAMRAAPAPKAAPDETATAAEATTEEGTTPAPVAADNRLSLLFGDLLAFLTAALPYFAILALIGTIAYLVTKRRKHP